jgi:acetyl-CoA carboxylase beta subunit
MVRYLAKCPNCGKNQMNYTKDILKARFKCRSCNKCVRVYGKNGRNIQIFSVTSY